LHQAGVSAPALVLTPHTALNMPSDVRRLLDAFVAPSRYSALFGCPVGAADGRAAGWIVAFTTDAAEARSLAVERRVQAVASAIDETLHGVTRVASMLGARFPTLSPEPLTPRELEVALLAGNGFSDLNIAQRLGITE